MIAGIDGYMLFLETMRNTQALRALRAGRCGARQTDHRLQARPLGGGARACRVPYRRARRRGRRRRCISDRLRHRACRNARWTDRRPAADRARAGHRAGHAPRRRRRADHHSRRRHHGGRSACRSGVAIEPPSAATLARLAAAGITVAPARLIDLTIAGTRYDVMKAALDILTTAPEFDLVLSVVGSSARFHPELAVQSDHRQCRRRKPIAAYRRRKPRRRWPRSAPPASASFRTPEACADAIAAALRRGARRCRSLPWSPALSGHGRLLDGQEAYAMHRPSWHLVRTHDRGRSRYIERSEATVSLPGRGQGTVGRHRPQDRRSAASFSALPMRKPCWRRSDKFVTALAQHRPGCSSIACWCSRW